MNTPVGSRNMSESEPSSWNRNRNMSTDRTLYSPSMEDGASNFPAKENTSTKSMMDRFKLVFRRKKKEEDDSVDPTAKESRLKKKQSAITLGARRKSSSASADRKRSLDLRPRSLDFPRRNSKITPVGKDAQGRYTLDKDTGEYIDHTNMLHALVHRESIDSIAEYIEPEQKDRKPGEAMIASLPPKLWQHITDYLTLSDVAHLALSSKTLLDKVGNESWRLINYPYAREHRIDFLLRMDRSLPGHLYCPLCERYHVRTQRGKESLKPTLTLNPLFVCNHIETAPPRIRIAAGRSLPFTFVQLALRAHRFGPDYGVTVESLARRWKEPETGWSHATIYRVHNGHLLMRVVSQKFAEGGMVDAAKRGFFFNMYEDFTPYFSVCAHWRDGDLMKICKCAVDHIPPPRYSITEAHKLKQTPLPQQPRIVAMCGTCQPMRRCPECPTEYMVEVKLVEDMKDKTNRFKQAVVVTRWSDLGDGSSPTNIEWAAVNGQAYYSSVIEIGRRAISGIFESKISNDNMNIPGQRVISLNPSGEKNDSDDDKWF